MMLSLEMVFEQLEDWGLDSDNGHQGVTADHQYPRREFAACGTMRGDVGRGEGDCLRVVGMVRSVVFAYIP